MSFRHDNAAGGGGHTFELEILQQLIRHRPVGNDEFVLVGPPGDLLAEARKNGFATIAVATRGMSRALLKAPHLGSRHGWRFGTRLDRRLGQARLDFLWCVGQDVPTLELPFALTVWDLQHRLQPYFPEVSSGGEWARRERYFATALRRAALVIVGTEAGRAEVGDFYSMPAERIVVLPHPTPSIDPEQRDDAVLRRHDLAPGFLFYPAQFWPHKNHVALLLALQRLRGRGVSVPPLVLVGADKGNLVHVCQVARDLDVTDLVRILGFVSRAELMSLYRHAAALTYVTFFGPENLPPLEAFALDCPVIASRVSGADEQLGDAALLVDPSDASALADAIERLLCDPHLRRHLIERGRARALRSTPASFVDGAVAAIRAFGAVRRSWPS